MHEAGGFLVGDFVLTGAYLFNIELKTDMCYILPKSTTNENRWYFFHLIMSHMA